MFAVLWLGDVEQGCGASSPPGEMGCFEGLSLHILFLSRRLLKPPISGVLGPRMYQKCNCSFNFFYAFIQILL